MQGHLQVRLGAFLTAAGLCQVVEKGFPIEGIGASLAQVNGKVHKLVGCQLALIYKPFVLPAIVSWQM